MSDKLKLSITSRSLRILQQNHLGKKLLALAIDLQSNKVTSNGLEKQIVVNKLTY